VKSIERFFLRARHWQLFLFLALIVVVGEIVTVWAMLSKDSSPTLAAVAGIANGAALGLSSLGLLGWIWSVGNFCNLLLPLGLQSPDRFFRFASVFPNIYVFVAGSYFLNPDLAYLPLVLPIHFFAVFCIFYDLIFAAKHLAMAETGKRVTFYEYAAPFFLMWFFPIGVWFVQPRVNRLHAENIALRLQTVADAG
jgi:hypothetical protein